MKTFELKEARRLAERLEIHHKSKNGNWLNKAEIELSIVKGQFLNRRIADMVTMLAEASTLESNRNSNTKKITEVSQQLTPESS